MPELLERTHVSFPTPGAPAEPGALRRDPERLARRDLRRQIGTLERELSELFASSRARPGVEWGIGAIGGPRVMSLGELERIRDALELRLRDVRGDLARRAEVEEANRTLLERMIAAPAKYRWVIVSNEDIGEPGCGHWHSRPRWGILGMLFGWWRIRHSSGCPLARGLRPPARRATSATVDGARKA